MLRALGIAAGLLTQLLFVATVARLVPFLSGPGEPPEATAESSAGWLAWDTFLALQFAVVHSALLHPSTRRFLGRWIGPGFYGLFFCVATCVGLLLVTEGWAVSSAVVWRLSGRARVLVIGAFVASWASLLYSLWLTGLGYQTGFTPWWAWFRGQAPARRTFEPRGAYRVLRHPVYLSFLGLVWFCPTVTLDRLWLCGLWTVYLFVGSWLKDRRLVHYLGDSYRRYQAVVPGYPGFFWGPLGKIAFQPGPPSVLVNKETPSAASPPVPSIGPRSTADRSMNSRAEPSTARRRALAS